MTFGEDADLMAHVHGTSDKPKDPVAVPAWLAVDSQARIAMYKTTSSNAVRSAHFKNILPPAGPQTAGAVWSSLKAEYQKDSRATRFDLKKRLYNPVHNTEQPISQYIQDIVSAAESLVALGHPPASADIVDSILMNLDPSFAVVRTMLTSQPTEPTLEIVKKMLVDQEDERRAITGESLVETAHYSKKKTKGRPKKDNSDSEDGDGTWLNPDNDDACHRCGKPGHRSSRCMLNMPQHIKDKIMKEARQRRKGKGKRRSRSSSSDESPERSNAVRFVGDEVHLPSTSESDSDSDSDSDDGLDPFRIHRGTESDSPDRALASHVLETRPMSKRSSKQARRILARIQA